jgi:hypothetical protein
MTLQLLRRLGTDATVQNVTCRGVNWVSWKEISGIIKMYSFTYNLQIKCSPENIAMEMFSYFCIWKSCQIFSAHFRYTLHIQTKKFLGKGNFRKSQLISKVKDFIKIPFQLSSNIQLSYLLKTPILKCMSQYRNDLEIIKRFVNLVYIISFIRQIYDKLINLINWSKLYKILEILKRT